MPATLQVGLPAAGAVATGPDSLLQIGPVLAQIIFFYWVIFLLDQIVCYGLGQFWPK
jgi:hypothetical protein